MSGRTQTWAPADPPAAAKRPRASKQAPAGPPVGDGPHSDEAELLAGYQRVSTREQRTDSQRADLAAAGCARIFSDHGVSGKHRNRPELDKCLAYLQPGDTFVITRLSRAMRSLKHLLGLADEFAERDINLRVLKQEIDTTTSTGRLVFKILGAIDEWQRELIVEGTMEGLAATDKKGGHPRALTPEQEAEVIAKLGGEDPVIAAIAREAGISRVAVHRIAKRAGVELPGNPAVPAGRTPMDAGKRAEILRLLRAGKSYNAAGRAAGVSHQTARRVWRDSGETGGPPGLGNRGGRPYAADEEKARIAAQLVNGGQPVAVVARAMGISQTAVNSAVERVRQEAGS